MCYYLLNASSSVPPSLIPSLRFFRIYPLLNLHEEGLLGLSSYLSQQVRGWRSFPQHPMNASRLTPRDLICSVYRQAESVLTRGQALQCATAI